MKSGDKNRRGQLKLSFGMIFSIFLIIIFLGLAFYVIKIFVGFQTTTTEKAFSTNLQSDVDNVWKGSESQQTFEYTLPSGKNHACFIDLSQSAGSGQDANLFSDLKYHSSSNSVNLILYPESGVSGVIINHINNPASGNENPYCFTASNGKVKIELSKGFNDRLVTISRPGA